MKAKVKSILKPREREKLELQTRQIFKVRPKTRTLGLVAEQRLDET